MRRVALATALLAAFAAPAVAGAPRWTAKGAITKLGAHAITVNGKACRITPVSPKLGLHVYVVGSKVKIVCAGGVLLAIDLLHPSASTGSSSSSSSTSTASSLTVAGDLAVTALGGGSISVEANSSTFTCTIGSGSPDVSGFHVGAHLSKLTCADGVLTSLAR
jgi:hypothetical protein